MRRPSSASLLSRHGPSRARSKTTTREISHLINVPQYISVRQPIATVTRITTQGQKDMRRKGSLITEGRRDSDDGGRV